MPRAALTRITGRASSPWWMRMDEPLGLVGGTAHMSTFDPYRIDLGRKTPRYQVEEV